MQHHDMGRHGMLVLGNKNNIFLLHLAMRNAPEHRFQLILKVDLEAGPATRIGDRSFVGKETSLDSTGANQVKTFLTVPLITLYYWFFTIYH